MEGQRKHKSRFAITNVILENISKIIKGFEDIPYESYVWKRFRHKHTGGYLYIAR